MLHGHAAVEPRGIPQAVSTVNTQHQAAAAIAVTGHCQRVTVVDHGITLTHRGVKTVDPAVAFLRFTGIGKYPVAGRVAVRILGGIGQRRDLTGELPRKLR